MDTQKMGKFILQQRKELGLTQAELAEKIHVTDKAISRWERGIGLPDINILEPLAEALNVNLIELVQSKKAIEEKISIQEAENIVLDTIQISTKGEVARTIGILTLGLFGMIAFFLSWLLITDGSIVAYSVGSIVTGLIAWAAPIWQMTLVKTAKIIAPGIISLGSALTSLTIQFFQIAQEVATRDFAAIEDTVPTLCLVVVFFSTTTLILNILMVFRTRKL